MVILFLVNFKGSVSPNDFSEVDPLNQAIPVEFVESEFKLECQGSPEMSQLVVTFYSSG